MTTKLEVKRRHNSQRVRTKAFERFQFARAIVIHFSHYYFVHFVVTSIGFRKRIISVDGKTTHLELGVKLNKEPKIKFPPYLKF